MLHPSPLGSKKRDPGFPESPFAQSLFVTAGKERFLSDYFWTYRVVASPSLFRTA